MLNHHLLKTLLINYNTIIYQAIKVSYLELRDIGMTLSYFTIITFKSMHIILLLSKSNFKMSNTKIGRKGSLLDPLNCMKLATIKSELILCLLDIIRIYTLDT